MNPICIEGSSAWRSRGKPPYLKLKNILYPVEIDHSCGINPSLSRHIRNHLKMVISCYIVISTTLYPNFPSCSLAKSPCLMIKPPRPYQYPIIHRLLLIVNTPQRPWLSRRYAHIRDRRMGVLNTYTFNIRGMRCLINIPVTMP